MFYNSNINIDENLWGEILQDKKITTQKVLSILLFILKQPKQESSGKEIALALNYTHHAPLNNIIPYFSKRILDKYNFVKKPSREDGTKRYWHIPFLGKNENDKFLWILRPELANALVEIFNLEIDNYYLPEEIEKEDILLFEGNTIQITVNKYERSKDARIICLKKYGYKCSVCGFDFEEKYGPIGKGKIHVHHITPISEYKKEYILDPINDLVPVCPNCHLMIHSKKEPFTIEELKEIIHNV
jgi:5-methylcytosine-specific restriction protein A